MAAQFLKIVQNVMAVGGLYQERRFHNEELSVGKQQHFQGLKQAYLHHSKDQKLGKQTYLLDLYITIEEHFQQLNADLVGSTRESERDMFDQRNQQLQTMILASSVMFSALSTVIIQGFLDTSAISPFLVIGYSLSTSLSFAFLFLSIVISIEIILRASKFMYHRSTRQSHNLQDAITNTNQVLKKIRYKGNNKNDGNRFTDMNDEQIEKEFKDHERTIEEFLLSRERIIDVAANQFLNKADKAVPAAVGENVKCSSDHDKSTSGINAVNAVNGTHAINMNGHGAVQGNGNGNGNGNANKSFNDFWHEKCKWWADVATSMFYLGTYSMLIALMIFMWSTFDITYGSPESASVAVILIGVSVIATVAVGVYMRCVENRKFKYDDGNSNGAGVHMVHTAVGVDSELNPSNTPGGFTAGSSRRRGSATTVVSHPSV